MQTNSLVRPSSRSRLHVRLFIILILCKFGVTHKVDNDTTDVTIIREIIERCSPNGGHISQVAFVLFDTFNHLDRLALVFEHLATPVSFVVVQINLETGHNYLTNLPTLLFGKRKSLIVFCYSNKASGKYLLKQLPTLTKLYKRTRLMFFADFQLSKRQVEDVFRKFFTHTFVNVLLAYKTQNQRYDLFEYYPYATPGSCGQYDQRNIVHIGKFVQTQLPSFASAWHFGESERIVRLLPAPLNGTAVFFGRKVPENLNACELRVTTLFWPPNVLDIEDSEAGIEIDFVRVIASKLNMSLAFNDLVSNGVGFQDVDGSWTGLMGTVQRSNVDIALGSVRPNTEILRSFDTSGWYLADALVWAVPVARHYKKSEVIWLLLMNLSGISYGLIALSFVIFSIALWCYAKLRYSERQRYKRYPFIVLTLVTSFLGQPVPVPPKLYAIRAIFILWVVYCFVIVSSFNTNLISYLTNPIMEYQIKSVEDLIKSNIDIVFDNDLYGNIIVNDEQGKYLQRRNHPGLIENGLQLTIAGKAATLISSLRCDFVTLQWLDSTGKSPVFQLIDDRIETYYSHIVMRKGHPLFDTVNDIVKKSSYMGFWKHLTKIYLNRRRIQTMTLRYLIFFNYKNGLDNSDALERFNTLINDTVYQIFLRKYQSKFKDVSKSQEEKDENAKHVDVVEKNYRKSDIQSIVDSFIKYPENTITFATFKACLTLFVSGQTTALIVFAMEVIVARFWSNCVQQTQRRFRFRR